MTARHARELLVAFRQDAIKTRYANWDELMEYCRYSAMPVGRHVLDLHGEDRATYAPSDALCASLQVLNHMQDCAKDLAALDRCYLPQDCWRGTAPPSMICAAPAETPGLRRVFDAMLDRTEALNAAPRGSAAPHARPAAAAGNRGHRRAGAPAGRAAAARRSAGDAGGADQGGCGASVLASLRFLP